MMNDKIIYGKVIRPVESFDESERVRFGLEGLNYSDMICVEDLFQEENSVFSWRKAFYDPNNHRIILTGCRNKRTNEFYSFLFSYNLNNRVWLTDEHDKELQSYCRLTMIG